MWPTTSLWPNALALAVIGAAIILCAQAGRVIGATMEGRRVLRLASAVLVLLLVAYLGAAWIGRHRRRASYMPKIIPHTLVTRI